MICIKAARDAAAYSRRVPDGGPSPFGWEDSSHGESFLNLLTQRLNGHGIYLFDEPEAALSPQRQLAMLVRLHDLTREFSQFIIATHSPLLMAFPDAWM